MKWVIFGTELTVVVFMKTLCVLCEVKTEIFCSMT